METSINKCGKCNYPHGEYSIGTDGEYFMCPRCGFQYITPPSISKQNVGYFVIATSDRGTQTGSYNDVAFLDELDRNSNENPHILSVGYSMKDSDGKFYWVIKDNSTKEVIQTEWLDNMFLFNGRLMSPKQFIDGNEEP